MLAIPASEHSQLHVPERLTAALMLLEALVIDHQFPCGAVCHLPQAHDLALGTGQHHGPSQTVNPWPFFTSPRPVSHADSTTSLVPHRSSAVTSDAVSIPSSVAPLRRWLAPPELAPRAEERVFREHRLALILTDTASDR